MTLRAAFAFLLLLCTAGAVPALAQPAALSVAILPMPGDDAIADEAARQVWPNVAALLTRMGHESGITVVDNDTVVRTVTDDPSAVEAARELNVRFVLMADVVSDNGIYRFHCQLRDGRTGAVVWAQVMFTDDFNITTFPHEIALTVLRVMGDVAA
jgi:TolB-like protein